MSRLTLEIRAEAVKLSRQRLPVVLILLTALAAGATPPLLRLGEELARLQEKERVSVTGFEALAAGVRVGYGAGTLILAVLAATAVSGDASLGTMRAALAHPVRRRDWLLAKASLLVGIATLLVILTWGIAVSSAWVTFGFDDVRDPIYPEYVHLSAGQMWGQVGRVALMSLGPLWAVAAVGLLFSVLMDSPAHAVGVTVGAVLVCGPLLAGLADGLAPYLVFSYVGSSLRSLAEIAGGGAAALEDVQITAGRLLPPLGVAGAALAAGFAALLRRDVLI